jgi:multiple sugar transport system substrate-binding protein
MWQAGGGIFSDDGSKNLLGSDQSKQAVQYWASLIHDNHISPPGLSGADADKLVSAGTAAMEVNGPWATTGYKQAGIDYGLAPIPTGPNGQHISLGNTTVLAISSSASSAKAKAAAQFYAYWAQKDIQIKFTQGSGFPPVTSNVSAADLSSNPDVAAFAGQSGTTRPLAPGQTKFATIQSDIFDPTIEKIINNPSKTNDLLDQAASQLTAMVGSN